MVNSLVRPQSMARPQPAVAAPAPRIGYVLKMYPRFSETFILNEILELERQGQDLHVFALKKPDEGRFHADVARVRAGVTYLPETWSARPGSLAAAHRSAARQAGAGYWRALAAAGRGGRRASLKHFWQAGYLAPRARALGITHLHAHFASSAAGVAWYLSALTGLPYSLTAHAKDIFRHGVDRRALARKLQDARFVVTVSDFNCRWLADIAADARVLRVYNGLDLDRFAPAAIPTEDPPLVLAVGRLVEKKGFADLVRASALLRDRGLAFRCAIVGQGEEAGALRALVADLGLTEQVTLPGPLPRDELLGLYPRATVFAAPCVVGADGNRDGLPTVLVEAMALGVPVVATPVTGIPELVRDGETGLLVPEGAPEALAEAIARLLADRSLRAGLAARGRARVEEDFDLSRNVAGLRALYAGAAG